MKTEKLQEKNAEGMMLYVHIPFCVHKCGYCDFYSGVFSEEDKRAYFERLLSEIREHPFSDRGIHVSSVFFGGGTPSSVDESFILRVLSELKKRFLVDPDAEISIEVNPGTVNAAFSEKIYAYRASGFNRLSIGLQSMDDRVLQQIGRIHTVRDFFSTYETARRAGFTNVNVDLIAGLPGENAGNFENGLKTLLALHPEHLSVYSLIIAENTPFYALYGPSGTRREELPGEETLLHTETRLRALLASSGYRRYEISNYALPGFECRHNRGYWTQRPYLGFGAGAASFVPEAQAEGGRAETGVMLRLKNPELLDYSDHSYVETERLDTAERMGERMMLSLRMINGIDNASFIRDFGVSLESAYGTLLSELEKERLLRIKREADGTIKSVCLSEKGLLLHNYVSERFLFS